MAFVQEISFSTEQRDAVLDLMGAWTADSMGQGTARRATLVENRSTPGSFVLSVLFDSPESAAENSARPETGAFAEQFTALCSDAPAFREFDVVAVYGAA